MIVKSKSKKRINPLTVEPVPPSLTFNPTFSLVLRYYKNNASDANVQQQDFSTLLCVATSATAGYSPIAAVRVLKLRMWAPCSTLTSATGFAPPQAKIRMPAGFLAPSTGSWCSEQVVQAYSTGSQMGYCSMKMRAPNNAWWEPNASGGTNVFSISGPVGCILDVHVVIRLLNNNAANSALTCAGATAGILYYNYLDATAGTLYLQCQNGVANTTRFT